MAIDVNREIRRAVDTGKVVFGLKQSMKSILNGNGQLIVIGSNTPETTKEKIKHFGKVAEIPFYEFKGTGLQLGSVCGKPFVVSVMVIEKPGKSKILNVVKQKK